MHLTHLKFCLAIHDLLQGGLLVAIRMYDHHRGFYHSSAAYRKKHETAEKSGVYDDTTVVFEHVPHAKISYAKPRAKCYMYVCMLHGSIKFSGTYTTQT